MFNKAHKAFSDLSFSMIFDSQSSWFIHSTLIIAFVAELDKGLFLNSVLWWHTTQSPLFYAMACWHKSKMLIDMLDDRHNAPKKKHGTVAQM